MFESKVMKSKEFRLIKTFTFAIVFSFIAALRTASGENYSTLVGPKTLSRTPIVEIEGFQYYSVGDVLIPIESIGPKFLPSGVTKWPNGVVKFHWSVCSGGGRPNPSIGPCISSLERDALKLAIATIESNSGGKVVFSKQAASGVNVLRLIGTDSNDFSGQCTLGLQTRSVCRFDRTNGGFTQRTIIHELLHALGFSHEHQRADRDEYVVVDPDFLDDTANYGIYQEGVTYGAYDFCSIMHYGLFQDPDGSGPKPVKAAFKEVVSGENSCGPSSSAAWSGNVMTSQDSVKLLRMYGDADSHVGTNGNVCSLNKAVGTPKHRSVFELCR